MTRSKSSTSVPVTPLIPTRRKKSYASNSIVDQVLGKKDNQDVPGFTKNISISRQKSITNVNDDVDVIIHNHAAADDIPDLITFETPFEKIRTTPSIAAAKKTSLPSRFTHSALKFRKKCYCLKKAKVNKYLLFGF